MMAAKATPTRPGLSKQQYQALADFRHELRRFQRYSEEVTRQHGVTPLQYQLLLHIQGYPGRDHATVGELAERLQAKHHGVVALVTRCERAGLVRRRPSETDRRAVYVHLTDEGLGSLERLAELHRRELLDLQRRLVTLAKGEL